MIEERGVRAQPRRPGALARASTSRGVDLMAGGPSESQAALGSAPDSGLTKGDRITGDQRSTLARSFGERYAGGESIRSIAQDTGRSYGFVHGVLKESGATLRGRGGATRGPRRGSVDKLEDQAD